MAATNQPPGPSAAAAEEDMEISSNVGDSAQEDEIDIDVDFVIDPGQNEDEDFMLDDAQPENGQGAEYRDDIMLDEDRDGDGDVEIEDGLMQDQTSIADEHLTDISEPAPVEVDVQIEHQDHETVEPRNEADDDLIDYDDDYPEEPQALVQSVQHEPEDLPTQTESESALPRTVQIDQQAEEHVEEFTEDADQETKNQAAKLEDSVRAEAPAFESPQQVHSLDSNSCEQHVSDEATTVTEDAHDNGNESRRDEAQEQESAQHNQVERQEPQDTPAYNEDASTLSQLPFDGHVEETDESYYQASAPHPTIVIYLGSEISLFPPTKESNSETFFLQDVSLVHHSIRDLLLACREVLGDSISDEDELEMDIAELGLCVSEDSSPATSTSFAQILDVYVQLYHLDGVQNPAPLYVTLTTKTRFSSRLQALLGAAADCQGLSHLTFLKVSADEGVDGELPSDDYGAGSEHQEEISYEQEQSEHHPPIEQTSEVRYGAPEDNFDEGATKTLGFEPSVDEISDTDSEGTQSVVEGAEDSHNQTAGEQSWLNASEPPAGGDASVVDSEHNVKRSVSCNEHCSPQSINDEVDPHETTDLHEAEQRGPAVGSQQLESVAVEQTPKQQQKLQAISHPLAGKDDDEIGYSSDEDEEKARNEKTPRSSTIEGDNSPAAVKFDAEIAHTSVASPPQHCPGTGQRGFERSARQNPTAQTSVENVQEPPTEEEHSNHVRDETHVVVDVDYVDYDFADHGEDPDEQSTVYDVQNVHDLPEDDAEPSEAGDLGNSTALGGDVADVYETIHDYDEVGWEDGDEVDPAEQPAAADEADEADESSHAEFQTRWKNPLATGEAGTGELESAAFEPHASGAQASQVNKTVAKLEDDDDLIDYDDDEELPPTTAAQADSKAVPTTAEPSSSVKRGWEEVSQQGDDVSDEQAMKRVKSE
ncbi:hypothetical protein K490DRAFT_67709 [Saccharata proteae CBS 121410]|uniref:Uncharacterized protein n=1 Tax=Saccharata proteae CBS 121410 TaxID=1314787 RepID=A0A9P4HPN1_9PEZI|nr:hypothetical protein K490DRAFT_67709 [Saccharata proteae CBS 121410]